MRYIVHTDGGARGNPGPAAIGVVIDEEIDGTYTRRAAFGKTIGETTNNVAEYKAVLSALQYFQTLAQSKPMGEATIQFFLDSLLVVNQLNGIYKVKDAKLRSLLFQIRTEEGALPCKILYASVPREQNKDADREVNQALDREEL